MVPDGQCTAAAVVSKLDVLVGTHTARAKKRETIKRRMSGF